MSDNISEEVQIKGRTARQGKRGSYSLVIHAGELERYQIFDKDVNRMMMSGELYSAIDKKRAQYFERKYANELQDLTTAQCAHEESMQFIGDMFSGNKENVMKYLLEKNHCGVDLNSALAGRRTVILMDATYSMVTLLEKTKVALSHMFQRAFNVIDESIRNGSLKNINAKDISFEMQLVAYRNYDTSAEDLLEVSPWATNAEPLRKFVMGLEAKHGWGHEAIEVALDHALKEHAREPIGQIVIIGDQAPNKRQETIDKRGNEYGRGEKYWKTTDFPEPVFFYELIQQAHDEKIPVHAIYLQEDTAREAFEGMSAPNEHAKSQYLDIESANAMEELTEIITCCMLESFVGFDERAQQLQASYQQSYGFIAPAEHAQGDPTQQASSSAAAQN